MLGELRTSNSFLVHPAVRYGLEWTVITHVDISRSLHRLPRTARLTVRLVVEGFTIGDIAHMTGRSWRSARRDVNHAREFLLANCKYPKG